MGPRFRGDDNRENCEEHERKMAGTSPAIPMFD
jgi:hypothetical protein